MENEFWINVELLSLGGNVSLMIIPRKKHVEIFLEDQELGRIYKDKNENWQDMDNSLPPFASDIIGRVIEEYIFGTVSSFKITG